MDSQSKIHDQAGGHVHITKETLAVISLEDLRAEHARQETLKKNAIDALDMCIQAIVDRTAEFKMGDLVVDGDGVTWQVTRIVGRNWFSDVRVEYHGRRIKKDGSAGAVESEIYRRPLLAADHHN